MFIMPAASQRRAFVFTLQPEMADRVMERIIGVNHGIFLQSLRDNLRD